MSTTLSLHHVGEVVLAGLLDELAKRDRLGSVACKLHPDCSLLSVMRNAAVQPPPSFAVNAKLAPVISGGKTARFDGAHGVDVLCHDGKRGLPIEAKLGLDRLSCSAFTSRFLGPLSLSTHKVPRFTGSMTAILNYRGIGGGDSLLLHTENPSVELAPQWFLVVREQTWKAWDADRPDLSNAHVATFEDIAKAYGDADAFDDLVLAQVGKRFHAAWGIAS